MRYVVTYDVSDDGRRRRLANVLEGFGDRVQLSVFEIECDAPELARLADALDELISAERDGLRIYRLCAGCQAATHTIGAGLLDRPTAWIV